MSNRRHWTEEELTQLRELFPTTPATDLADIFHCCDSTVLNKARELGLKRDQSFSTSGYKGRYTKNAGKYNIYKR